jgi:dTDP-4-dehydrorhamnose reductase
MTVAMRKMRVLITGASGMLGNHLCRLLAKSRKYLVFGTSRKEPSEFIGDNFFLGDLTDNEFVNNVLKDAKSDVTIHCAANVNIDDCENNREYTRQLHVAATARLAAYNQSTHFIYISTDSVFDGKKGYYSESDMPHPLNYYAQSKLEGEYSALNNSKGALVLRTNIYGVHQLPGRSLSEWGLKNFAARRTISGFTNVYFNPVYTGQLANVIIQLIEKKTTGIVNAASNEKINKYQFLVRLAGVFGYPANMVAEGVLDNTCFSTLRPMNTTLNTSGLQNLIGQAPSLKEGLNELKRDWDRSRSSICRPGAFHEGRGNQQ